MENKKEIILNEIISTLSLFYRDRADDFYEDEEEENAASLRFREDAELIVNKDKDSSFRGVLAMLEIELRRLGQLKNELNTLKSLIKAYNNNKLSE